MVNYITRIVYRSMMILKTCIYHYQLPWILSVNLMVGWGQSAHPVLQEASRSGLRRQRYRGTHPRIDDPNGAICDE